MELGVRITGERRVALRFEQFPNIAREKLLQVVTAYQRSLQEAVQSKVPKGKTGKLASSVTGGVENQDNKIRGWVNVAGRDKELILQAMALEYGSNKRIKVSAKNGRALYTVYGRYISPMEVNVAAYGRTSNIVAQRFLRDPLAQVSNQYLDAAQQAVLEATQEA